MSLSLNLVELVKVIRPDWNPEVIMACLAEAATSHPPPHIIHAMMHAATDPECRTPRGFFMPKHWPTDSRQARNPPDCPLHIGQLEHNCSPCRAEQIAVPDGYTPPRRPNGAPMPDHVREQLRRRKRDHSKATGDLEPPEIP